MQGDSVKTDVSVIMGCYDSEDTLEEALSSVLSQEFSGAFEVIAVDDGSRDSTPEILKRFAARDARLNVLVHPANRGGGAARNTAIRAARAPIIMDVDSDNMLGTGTLQTMHAFLSSRPDLHGALYEEQRIFRGKDVRHFEPFHYYTETAPLELRAVFQFPNVQFGNLMCRREAYAIAGGYPEHHGFDTQGFCMRFLSRGLRAQVAPGSFYWHRTGRSQASYFERVFDSGRYNLNTYLIYEDLIERFSNPALRTIMNANVFRASGFGAEGIGAGLEALERSGVEVLKRDGDGGWDAASAVFVRGVVALRDNDYETALQSFVELAKGGLSAPLLVFNTIRCSLGLAGTEPARIVDAALAATEQLRLRKLPSTRRWSLVDRALVKAARITLRALGIEDPVS